MDKKELWSKVKIAFEKGYVITKDVTVKSAKTVATYAGEASQLTRNKVNEMKVSRQLAKEFAALGARVYALSSKGNGAKVLDDGIVKKSLTKTKQLDADLHKAQAKVKSELEKIRHRSKVKTKKK